MDESERPPVSRLDEIRARVEALVAIAGEHGAPMRLDDMFQLLPYPAFRDASDFEEFLRADPVLRNRVSLHDHLLVENGDFRLIATHRALGPMTSRRIGIAQNFVDRLVQRCPWVLVAAVSGSTVYGHAQREDDLDFFLVVARRRMWITLLVAFLLGRIDRKSRRSLTYCFNRTLEDYECIRDLNARTDPLIAREALTMLVLKGESYYSSLLSSSAWMGHYFPLLYEARLKNKESGPERQSSPRGGAQWALLNGIAFVIVATYLTAMGFARNSHLFRKGRLGAQFRTVIRLGFCAYESNKYDGLRAAYREVIH